MVRFDGSSKFKRGRFIGLGDDDKMGLGAVIVG